jgi:hypothetical protein
MDNVMTKGFCELNENEIMGVDGGFGGLLAVGIVGVVGVTICGYGYGTYLNVQAAYTNYKADQIARQTAMTRALYNLDQTY